MGTQNKKVLVLIDWYLPGYKAGGPIQSVANMARALKETVTFSIVTMNIDSGETTPYKSVISDDWTTGPDGARVYYFSKQAFGLRKLKQLLATETYDVLYLNNFFSIRFTVLPLLLLKFLRMKTKVVLATRGVLASECLKIKPKKKFLFLSLTKTIKLFENITWHASTTIEEHEIRRNFGDSSKILTAIDLTAKQQLGLSSREKIPKQAKFVFLARIVPVKNLAPVINALNKLTADFEVDFDIYGTIEDQPYWEECEALIKSAPPHVKIAYKGGIQHSKVNSTLQMYHFGILYTKNENFGHSIIEQLSVGLPVIISDKTPWNGLEEKKIGWNISITDEVALLTAVNSACNMDQKTYKEWSQAAFNFASDILNNEAALAANRALFD